MSSSPAMVSRGVAANVSAPLPSNSSETPPRTTAKLACAPARPRSIDAIPINLNAAVPGAEQQLLVACRQP